MKKIIMKIGAAALIASAAGCASVTYSTPGKMDKVAVKGVKSVEGARFVMIDTSGYYMFWTIPLVSGNLRWNDQKRSIEGGTSLFRDQVGLGELQNALIKLADQALTATHVNEVIHGLLINGIFEWRNMLLERGAPTEDVDDLILKIIKKAEGK